MKKPSIKLLLLSILLCCIISGCVGLLKNERMDEMIEQLIIALNEDDADQIFQSMYPDAVTREEFDALYEGISERWEKSDSYTFKLNSINTNKSINNSGDTIICKAQYYVYTENDNFTFNITYRSDDKGEGLYAFDIMHGTIPVLISGGFTTAKENSTPQWGALIFGVLSYIFIIITIIDILRKRPRLYGIWLVAAMTFFAFQVQIVPGNLHMGGFVTWFAMSAFKIYSNKTCNFVFALPVGAVVYWFFRKKMLAQKCEPDKLPINQ